tara:strand:+ start:467 stop:895 length:429 start_codon:yes stop_codon:yes gene_type:complete
MMMSLGLFVWSLNTLSYQDLQRQSAWRHPSQSRVGQRPARQFVGPGDDSITLSGWLAPELSGERVSLALLRAMADAGEPYVLVAGTGKVYGLWVIESLSEDHSLFYPNGQARRIEFSLSLARVDDDLIDKVSLVTSALDLLG